MFFIISKILDFFINPFYWVVGLLFIGLFLKSKKKKSSRKYIISSIILLIFFTNPLLYNLASRIWEVPSYSADDITSEYDVGILLGGSVQTYDLKANRPLYSQSVDRLLQTIELYKKGKIKKVLLSGGSGQVFEQNYKESDFVYSVLLNAGIPKNDIIVENKSKNTFENALFSAQELSSYTGDRSFLLITSASHMRRSLACFNKVGLQADPFPVDVKSRPYSFTPDQSFLPNVYGFTVWDQLMHEWFGMVAYKFAGYI